MNSKDWRKRKMTIPKPWRGPKDPRKMKTGKEAHEQGGKYQKEVAEYLGMVNLWPLPGIDIADGELFGISAKKLGAGFPETMERLLEDAEISTNKKIPGASGILVIGKAKTKRYIGEDLCVMRLNILKWMLDQLKEKKSENIGD